MSEPVPSGADRKRIYGVIGVIRLVAGPYLIVVTERRLVGAINGHQIWEMRKAECVPFARTTLHLTEKEASQVVKLLST